MYSNNKHEISQQIPQHFCSLLPTEALILSSQRKVNHQMSLSPYLHCYQGCSFVCQLYSCFFFCLKVFMRINLWRWQSCWRTTEHKVTRGRTKMAAKKTAARQPGPATSCLSSALQQLYSVLQQALSWPTAQRPWPGVAGHRSAKDSPADHNTSRVLQMALSTWGCSWQAEAGITRSICRVAGVEVGEHQLHSQHWEEG